MLNTENKCCKSQQQELKGILIPHCTVKRGENEKIGDANVDTSKHSNKN